MDQEKQETKDGLKVVDKVDEDTKKIVDERNQLREELAKYKGAFNVSLVTITKIILQPFVGKRYITKTEIEYSNYFLAAWMRPMAAALAGSDRNKAYTQALAKMVGTCFSTYVDYYRIATAEHRVKHGGCTFEIYEEGGAPFVKQVEPDLPKSKFDGKSLFVLMAEPEEPEDKAN